MRDTKRKRIEAAVGEAMNVTLVCCGFVGLTLATGPLSWWVFVLTAGGWWLVLPLKAKLGGFNDGR